MLSEILLLLAGHPSALVEVVPAAESHSIDVNDAAALTTESELRDALDASVHIQKDVPLRAGERMQLETLADMAYKFRIVRRFAQIQVENARTQILRRAVARPGRSGGHHERVSAHLASLCTAILSVLDTYVDRILRLEQAILHRDSRLVSSHSFVSLLSLRAELADWQPRLDALVRLMRILIDGPRASQTLLGLPPTVDAALLPTGIGGWTGGLLIDLLSHLASTGIARVAEVMAELRSTVEHSWTILLIDWVCHGVVSGNPVSLGSHLSSTGRDALVEQATSTAQAPSGGWVLRPWALPQSIPPPLAETILYLGRCVHRVKFFAASDHSPETGPVPLSVVTVHAARLREPDVRPSQPMLFSSVLYELQQEVGEWLWRTVLNNEAVVGALEDLGHFFLLRNGSFTRALLSELDRTRQEKRMYARTASSAALHEADLEAALHRASLGTELEDHPSLDRIHWQSIQTNGSEAESSGVNDSDQSMLVRLGVDTARGIEAFVEKCALQAELPGYQLAYTAEYPLDLFLSPTELGCYSSIFSYLFSLCHTQRQVVACWSSLSNSQRVRRKFTGIGEGGVDQKEVKRRSHLLRLTWCLARDLIWFLDTLMGHFQTDVIEVQYGNLLGQLYQAHEQRQDRREKRLSNASSYAGSPSRAPSSIPGLGSRRSPRKQTLSFPTKQSEAGSPLKDRLKLAEDAPRIKQSESHSRLPFPTASQQTLGGPSPVPPSSSPDHDSLFRIRSYSTPVSDKRATRPPSTLGAQGSPRKVKPSLGRRSVVPTNALGSTPQGPSTTLTATEGGAPGPSRARLDFADLRTSHLTFLAYVQEGLLLSSPPLARLVQAIVTNCDRFVGQINRWGGDVLPDLLSEGSLSDDRDNRAESAVLEERYRSISQLVIEVREQLRDFFEFVAEGPAAAAAQADPALGSATKAKHTASGAATTAHAATAGKSEQLRSEMGASARQHLTQLAARLDFNGFFTGTNLRHYEEAQRARADLRMGSIEPGL